MEPPSSQAIDEDNQEAIINANVAELESQYEDYNNETLTATPVKANDNRPQPSAPKKKENNDINWHSWWKTTCIKMKAPIY